VFCFGTRTGASGKGEIAAMFTDTKQHSRSAERAWWWVAVAVWVAALVTVLAACLLAAGPAGA
jgi:Na+-driven multidrug efflux pump